MRKFIYIFIAVLLIGGLSLGQAFAVTPGYRQDPGTGDILGQGKYQSDPHKIFRMVRYVQLTHDNASTVDADAIMVWSLQEDDGVTITTSTTSSDSTVAGIIVTRALTQDTDGNTAAQDRGKDNWTWLQTYGLSQADVASTGGVGQFAGSKFGTSATAGLIAGFVPNTTNPELNGAAGFVYDASAASATDIEVFLIGLD